MQKSEAFKRRQSVYVAAPPPAKASPELSTRRVNGRIPTASHKSNNIVKRPPIGATSVRNAPRTVATSANRQAPNRLASTANRKQTVALKPQQSKNANLARNMKAKTTTRGAIGKTSKPQSLQLNGQKLAMAMNEENVHLVEVKTPQNMKRTGPPNFFISTQIKKVTVDVVPEDISPFKMFNDGNRTYDKETKGEVEAAVKTYNEVSPKAAQAPINYLSPYVSVSRGKVNREEEKSRRSTFYLELNDLIPQKENKEPQQQNEETKALNAAAMHTLETVRFYRRLLDSEIARLHALCDEWSSYKCSHAEILEKQGCDDMIDAAVGQTRLLTSKKFMQFKGLIDRCEAYANGSEVPQNDEGENKKLITAVDLEGFWGMVSIQVDNLDQRFEKLKQWRDNNWVDPEMMVKESQNVKQKKRNLTKENRKKKSEPKGQTEAGASKGTSCSEFIRMMRRKNAEKRKQTELCVQEPEKGFEDDIGTFESKSNEVGPFENKAAMTAIDRRALRLSKGDCGGQLHTILVPDRKMFSMSPTIISINRPSKRASIMKRDEPLLLNVTPEFHEAADNVHLNRLSTPKPHTPIMSSARKSILKTPGSIRSRLKNVAFNEKLRVQQFNFLDCNEDVGSVEEKGTTEDVKPNTTDEGMSK